MLKVDGDWKIQYPDSPLLISWCNDRSAGCRNLSTKNACMYVYAAKSLLRQVLHPSLARNLAKN